MFLLINGPSIQPFIMSAECELPDPETLSLLWIVKLTSHNHLSFSNFLFLFSIYIYIYIYIYMCVCVCMCLCYYGGTDGVMITIIGIGNGDLS